jgi:hypothetical protein
MRRHAAPSALDVGKIFGHRADRAVLLDELRYHVVKRLEQARMNLNVPVAVGHNVVACAGLRFGRGRQLVLFALRRDVVDVDIDLVLFAPLLANLIKRLVGAGHPVIPAA